MLSVKPWRGEAVLFFIGLQAVFFLIGSAVMSLLQKAGVNGFKGAEDFGNVLVGTLMFQGVTCLLMGFFFHYHKVSWREGLGLTKKKLFLSLLIAPGAMLIILPVALGLQEVSIALMKKIGWTPQNETAVTLLTNASTTAEQIYLAGFAIVLAPVAEEFIFRGLLFPYIKQRGFPMSAWIGVNFLFAIFHGDPGILIPLFVLSLALTWLYELTDSLMAPIFAHALFNTANLILLKYTPH